jgi:ABC-type nitrate/sulfonate/bicarbonate transport system ATPase subunit
LLHRPRVLLLDEPFTALDATSAERLRAHLAGWIGQGNAMVIVTHHLAEAWDLSTRVAVLSGGKWALEERRAGDLATFLPRYHGLVHA